VTGVIVCIAVNSKVVGVCIDDFVVISSVVVTRVVVVILACDGRLLGLKIPSVAAIPANGTAAIIDEQRSVFEGSL
jgi:hypothetical protein